MDAALADELRALRARAYGPEADIADDPQAVTRLRELEDLHVRSRAGSPRAAEFPEHRDAVRLATSTAAADRDMDAGALPASAEGAPPDVLQDAPDHVPDEHPRAARSSFIARHRTALWISSLAAAAAAAAAVTYGAVSFAPVAVSSGAPQITTLKPDPTIELPSGWFGRTEDALAWEFYGLTLSLGTTGFNGTAGDRCLSAFDATRLSTPDDSNGGSYSYSGVVYSGCQAGVFPATIVVPLDGRPGDVTPESLRARFPDAKALQFVLDGDQVGVFLDSGD